MVLKKSLVILSLTFTVLLSRIVFAGALEDCSEYTRMGIPGQDGDLLCRTGYLLSHSSSNKTPFWVIEHLTQEKADANDVKRYDKFMADPNLEKGKRAELSDYKNSGYDRGHMAPAADMKWSHAAMIDCFFLSNMVPQAGLGMNRGIWARLEDDVRKWAVSRGELFVYTGPIYVAEVKKTIGGNHVAVPTHLYKIVFAPSTHEVIAFIMPNIPIKTEDMPNYLVPVRVVEDLTGLDFLSVFDKQTQDDIETKKGDGFWQ